MNAEERQDWAERVRFVRAELTAIETDLASEPGPYELTEVDNWLDHLETTMTTEK